MNLVFAGTPEFAAAVLDALLASRHRVLAAYTQPDRPAGRGRRTSESPVKRLAARHGLDVRQPATLRGDDAAATLGATGADALIVAAYGLLLPPSILATPPHGCINVHASLLPRWRGAAPIQRAILAGDTRTGISIMQMDEGLDTGPVLATASCPIEDDDTAGTLHDRLAALGADLLLDALDDIEDGRAEPRTQDAGAATYAARLTKDEARVDWTRPAAEIARAVRAFDPWPVSFTTVPGRGERQRLRIWRARPAVRPGERATPGSPGTVIGTDRRALSVATGDGVLDLLEIQPPGGRRMPAGDWLNAHPLATGTVLGGPLDE